MANDDAGRTIRTTAPRRRRSAGTWRKRRPAVEGLESRRLLSVNLAEFPIRTEGGDPLGVASGAGSDKNIWFTLGSNNIGMINPANTAAGVTQYPIPTNNSGAGPIAAGPDGNYWFFEQAADKFGVINPATGQITEIPLLGAASPGVDGIAAGPNGTIWFTEFNTNQVGEINTATDQVTLYPLITPGAEPYGITKGPDGKLWFTEAGANQVGTIDPTTHVVTEYPIDSSGNDEAEGIAAGPDGNLWFTLTGTSKIGVMNPSGTLVAEYATKTAGAQPDAIVTGSDGSLWFTEAGPTGSFADGVVGKITTAGAVTEYTTQYYNANLGGIAAGSDGNLWFIAPNATGIDSVNPTSHAFNQYKYATTLGDAATGITADAGGNLWFTQRSDDQVGVLNPATDITTEYALPTSYQGPLGIALGADGNIWFADAGYDDGGAAQVGTIQPSSGQIAQYTVETASSAPYQIVSDPLDGNLWFTEENKDQVGRINPKTHAIAEYAVPTASAEPEAIAVDASGNIWFTEYSSDRIAEFSYNDPNQITEYNIPGTPYGIAAGPDGNIWFTEYAGFSGYKIGVFSPSSDSVIAQYAIPNGGAAKAIIAAPDGNLWFTDPSGQIGSITTAGAITEYPVPKADPQAIAAGPDGNIWFTATGTYNGSNGTYAPNVIGVVTLTQAATPTQLAVSTQPPGSVTAGKGFGLVVTVEDAAGNPDPDYTGTVTIALGSNPASDTLKGTLTEPVVDGQAIFSGLTLKDAGTGYTIQATASGLTSSSTSPFNVTLGATKLLVTTEPPSSVGAGAAFGLTVTAEDGQGNVDTSYDGPITLTLGNHPGGSTLGGVLVVGATDGVATFTGLTLNVPSNDYTILASSGSLTSATTIGFDVAAGPAAQLAIAANGGPPSSVLAGGLFSITVVAEDQYGDPATGFNGPVTLALANGGSVTLQGGTTGNAAGGQITFTGLSIDKVGDYKIQATSGTLAAATTGFVDVTAGAATQLVVASGNPPSSVAAGANFGFTVNAEDAFGNLDTTFGGTITAGLVDSPGVVLHGSNTATAKNGVATFSGLAITTAGAYTIQATSGTLAAGQTGSIAVTAGAVKALAIAQQPPSTVAAGGTFGLAVDAVDQYGNPVSTYTGSVAIALASGSGATLGGTLSGAAQAGVATFSGLSIARAGSYTIQATSGSLTKATTSTFAVTAAGPAKLVILAQPSSTATAGQALATPPQVAIEDADGNVETGDNSTQISVALASGPGKLLGTATATVQGGIATFPGLFDRAAGTIALAFSASGLAGATSNSIVVAPAAPSLLLITAQPSPTASAGVAFATQPVVVEEDQYGNVETSDDSTVITATLQSGAGPIVDATATVSGGVATFAGLADRKVETITLAFSGGGLTTATSNPVVVGPGAATQLVIQIQPYAAVTAGDPLTDPIVIAEEDAYGNVVTTDNSTQVTASLDTGGGTLYGTTTVTVQAGIASFDALEDDRAGSLSLQFSAGKLPPVVSNPSVVSPAAASKLVVKRPPGGVIAGDEFPVEVDAQDPYGNLATSFNGPVTLGLASGSGGNLSGTLTETASGGVAQFNDLVSTQSGDISLGATSGSLSTGTTGGASVPVSPAAPTQLVVQAQPPGSVTAGQPIATGTAPVVVAEEDAYGNVITTDSSTRVTASLSDAAAGLLGTTTATLSGGVATFTSLSTDTAGTMTLDFAAGGLTSAASDAIVVKPAAPAKLAIRTQPSSTATAGAAFATQPVVVEEDQYGNVETSDSSTRVTASLASGTGPLLGTTDVALQAGVGTFSGLADDRAETITLGFAGGGLTAGPSNDVVIGAAGASQLVLQAQPASTATAGVPFATQPVVVEEDQYGNVEKSDSSTQVTASLATGSGPLVGASVTVSGGVATFAGLADDTAETITLSFGGGGLTVADPTSIVVSPGATAKLAIRTQPSSTATAGVAFATQPVVVEEDQYGNVEAGDDRSTIAVSLGSGTGPLQGTTTVTVAGGVATFTDLAEDVAGTITLRFAAGGSVTATSGPIVVSAGQATQLVVTTPPPGALDSGQSFGMVVTAEDRFGNVATGYNGGVSITLPGSSGTTETVQAQAGLATFTGLTLDSGAQGQAISVGGAGLPSTSTAPVTIHTSVVNEQPPTITSEIVVMSRKTNRKGKPKGKPVLTGFVLQYSAAMDPGSAGSTANYTVGTAVTKRVKHRKITTYKPVPFVASYNAATNSVTLTLSGKQAFAAGGQITVNDSSGGVTSQDGLPLDPSDATFTIQKKATSVTLG